YTTLKIDEVNNLGAARIRIRSLLSAIRVREEKHSTRTIVPSSIKKIPFTKEMRKTYTILCPQMSPIHFDLIEPVFHAHGYHVVILPNDNKTSVNSMVVGQIMNAIMSGHYDTDHLAIIITQTGGGCRASNYIGFIRRALEKAGFSHIPVISLNLSGLEENPGFKLTVPLVIRSMYAIIFGDIFMKCVYKVRPYEAMPGTANNMHEKWKQVCIDALTQKHFSFSAFKHLCQDIIYDFDHLEQRHIKKPQVGIVGEILVKFLPSANNYLVNLLESEGAEAVVPDLLDFLLYCFYNTNFKSTHLGMSKFAAVKGNLGIKLLEFLRSSASKAFEKSTHFEAPAKISELAHMAKDIVSLGNQTGEGWFLTGEMLELIHSGTSNIVCAQPFACLPNHVVGKGVIKELRRRYPRSNIVAIDYDPGASEVNQLKRIKVMLSTAQKNLD
ncbi:MAG: 2-hydroxyacyl-CoA dehydratase, partial [Lachnospiraceae bacterium]